MPVTSYTQPFERLNDRTLLVEAPKPEAVMYLDYDGTLHHESVYWDPVRKQPFIQATERYTLFQHAPFAGRNNDLVPEHRLRPEHILGPALRPQRGGKGAPCRHTQPGDWQHVRRPGAR